MKTILKTAGWLAVPTRAQLSYYANDDGEILYTDESPQERKGAEKASADKGSANGLVSSDAKQDGPDAHEVNSAAPANAAAPHLLHRLVTETAHRHNIDPALLGAVISTESNWNTAISRKGAWGLMHFGVYNPFGWDTKRRGGGNLPRHPAGTM